MSTDRALLLTRARGRRSSLRLAVPWVAACWAAIGIADPGYRAALRGAQPPAEDKAKAKEAAAEREAAAESAFETLRAQFEQERTKEPWERTATIEKLSTAPCKKAIDFLAGLYKAEENPGIRLAVSRALAGMGTLDAAKVLVEVGFPLLVSDSFMAEEIGPLLRHPFQTDAEEWLVRGALTPEVRKSPEVTGAVLKSLARMKTPKRIPLLLAEIQRGEPEVQAAILEELRPSGDKAVAKAALALMRSPNASVQVAAHEVLAAMDGAAYRPHFVKGLKSPHWEVRALSVDVLGSGKEKGLVKQLSPLLQDPDKRVRIAVVEAFLKVGGSEVIEPLFRAIDTSDPRVQDDIADTLARLTGQNFGPVSAQWESWWAQAKTKPAEYRAMSTEEFAKLKEEDAAKSKTVYFGLRVLSNNLAFLIDSSQSMEEEYAPKGRTTAGKEEPGARGKTVVADPRKTKGKTSKKRMTSKMDIAKKELTQVVNALRDGQALDILSFSTTVTDFIQTVGSPGSEQLLKLSAAVRGPVLKFVNDNRPGGLTNISGAIKAAMSYADLDTIYLLSDGAPTAGITNHEELLQEIEKLNRRRRVKINTISFDPKPDERKLLQAIADRNHGVYVER